MNTRAPNEAVIESRVMITALIGITTEPNRKNRISALAPSVRAIAYGIVADWLAMKSWPVAARPPTCGRDAVDRDRADAGHDGRPGRAERRERADRVEPDGRAADVGLLETGRGRPRARAAAGRAAWRTARRCPLRRASAPVAGSWRLANGPSTRSTPSSASIAAERSGPAGRWPRRSGSRRPSARTMIGEVSPARKSRRQRDRGLAALDARGQDRRVRDALLEAQERGAEQAAAGRGSG